MRNSPPECLRRYGARHSLNLFSAPLGQDTIRAHFRTSALAPFHTSQLELSIPQPPWPNGRACEPGLPSAWLARPPAWPTRPPASSASSTASANDRLSGWQARLDGASDGANDGADRSGAIGGAGRYGRGLGTK
jgi:hypothetical protein